MTFQCEIEELDTQPTLSIRTQTAVAKLPEVMGQAYGRIAQYLGELGEEPAGPAFAGYFNMDMENLDVEIGFPVGKSLAGKEDIRSGELPAGRYGVCLHQGPYDAIEPAYKALTDFVNEQGLTPTGLSYEMYLNDPQATPPEELQTRILFPLAS